MLKILSTEKQPSNFIYLFIYLFSLAHYLSDTSLKCECITVKFFFFPKIIIIIIIILAQMKKIHCKINFLLLKLCKVLLEIWYLNYFYFRDIFICNIINYRYVCLGWE